MRIAIGADHAGFDLKQELTGWLRGLGHDVKDFGTNSAEPADYPPICAAVARDVAASRSQFGIVLGGSGQGEAMSANKVRGIRAALCNDLPLARLAREHNDANVLSMGARVVTGELAREIVETFLQTPFEGGRHIPRIEKIAEIERQEIEQP